MNKMKIKDTRTQMDKIHDYKILRSAQRIVEDRKIETLFGDSKENFFYATLSEGLAILVREMNEEARGKQE
jgi:hypothetical protein